MQGIPKTHFDTGSFISQYPTALEEARQQACWAATPEILGIADSVYVAVRRREVDVQHRHPKASTSNSFEMAVAAVIPLFGLESVAAVSGTH